MKIKVCILFFVICNTLAINAQNFNFQRAWATYFGDESCLTSSSNSFYIQNLKSKIDTNGNLFLVGTVYNNPNPQFLIATSNGFQTTFGGGESDGFIVKFDPNGVPLWATYFGGNGDDGITGISIDDQNNIFISGSTTSTQEIATANGYQTSLSGTIDGFLARFTADGNRVWSTYYGGNGYDDIEDVVLDSEGNLFVFCYTESDAMATAGTFQPTQNNSNYLITSFTKSGIRNWASYYGTNGSKITSIGANTSGLYVYGSTNDCSPYLPNSYFATTGCHQQEPGSCSDAFLSKFSNSGQRIWSTYYGGNSLEYDAGDGVICSANSIYITGYAYSNNNITTVGAFQEMFSPPFTSFLVKFNNDGVREWGTFYGKTIVTSGSRPASVNIDNQDNVYLSGYTGFSQNIATLGSYQEVLSGGIDAFVVKFNPSGERLWGTYYGDLGLENCKTLFYNDSFYLVGATTSIQNMTTIGAFQTNFINNANPNATLPSNIFIAKFEPIPLTNNQFENNLIQIYPNPNNGKFTLKEKSNSFSQKGKLSIYDALGRKIKNFELDANENYFNQEFDCSAILSSGVYTVKLEFDTTESKTFKMIVN
jgi:Secretion system C-terminal sorting domain/Beta-propeller repeat